MEISTGRPDIKALLDRTAEEASHSSTVGVYVAGAPLWLASVYTFQGVGELKRAAPGG